MCSIISVSLGGLDLSKSFLHGLFVYTEGLGIIQLFCERICQNKKLSCLQAMLYQCFLQIVLLGVSVAKHSC